MFYELMPKFKCRPASDKAYIGGWYECSPEDFCGFEDKIEYEIDYTDLTSLKNWVYEYDMACAPRYQWGLFGSRMGHWPAARAIARLPRGSLAAGHPAG